VVATGKVFSILDQTNAFFQTRMRDTEIPLTAVKDPWGLHKWVVMPMGLTNTPATHQVQLEEALGEVINKICVVYLNNIVVFSGYFDKHENTSKKSCNASERPTFIASPRRRSYSRPKLGS
jgi:hypothetical protein